MCPSTRAAKKTVASPDTISSSSVAVGAGAERESCGTSRAMASTSSGVTSSTISMVVATAVDRSGTTWLPAALRPNVRPCLRPRHPTSPGAWPRPSSRSWARSTSRPSATPAYAALGFHPSPGDANGVALPDGPAYFTSRGSVMGQVHGDGRGSGLRRVQPGRGRSCGHLRLDAAPTPTTICTARTDGALAQLRRILGDEPDGLHRVVQLLLTAVEPLRADGKPLFAGITALPMPDPPLGVAWRLGDMLHEYRGDAHITAWTGRRPSILPEIGLLTERYWGLPARSYVRTRAWTSDDLDEADERLRSRRHFEADGSGMTEAGCGGARGGRGADRPDVPAAHGHARRGRRRARRPAGAVGCRDPGPGRLPAVGPARTGRALRPPLTRTAAVTRAAT